MPISIIIPTLNEEDSIGALLHQLQHCRMQGNEVIIVDGGSNDKTFSISSLFADKVIQSKPGRAEQMNVGAAAATYNSLWFLHADTIIGDNSIENIEQALSQNKWGRFNIKLSGERFFFRIIEKMINIRSCLTGVATGDQGIFVKKSSFEMVNGYSDILLMEDIDLSKKLKRLSKPVCIKEKLVTSSRRWEKNGIISTVFVMWRLRFLYWLGMSADSLAAQYK